MRFLTRSSVKMVVLWITLLFLQQAYSLMPAKIVQLGESATLTCALPKQLGSRAVYWYKQHIGETLKIIAALYRTTAPEYGPEFSKSRFNVNNDKDFSSLTILKTVQEDEGIYHCGISEWINAEWSGTYLFVKGNAQRASDYIVVQQPKESKLVRPGDTETLHCSVFSDSENETCPGDHNVFWFRAGSHRSHPNIIYTDKNGHHECENRSESLKRCHFSKNISFSDAGTYYCAVATCGEILFGHGTTLELEQTTQAVFIQMALLIVSLAISVIGNIFLIFYQRVWKQFKGGESAKSGPQNDKSHQASEADEELNYAALNFAERQTRGRRKREFAEDSVYSQVTG